MSCKKGSKRKPYNVKSHRLSNHPLVTIRAGMKSRCYNPKHNMYYAYGGRGIKICDDWATNFISFYDWCISNGWAKGLQIDRINNDGNYEPMNCRIVTCKQNNQNKNNNVIITYKGQTKVLFDWSIEIGVNQTTLSRRLKKMPIEEAMNHVKYSRTTIK